MNVVDIWAGPQVTLRTMIRHAAEIIHPKTTASAYPVLLKFPQLRTVALALVRADHAGESTATLQEIALELAQIMKAANASRPVPDKAVRPASEITHRPQQLRQRDEELRALRRKALTSRSAAPMPALFDLPTKPEKPKAAKRQPNSTSTGTAERAFFERTL